MADITQQALQHLSALREQALAQPPSQWCQAYFLGTAGALVLLQALPRSLRSILSDYGARSTGKDGDNKDDGDGGQGKKDRASQPSSALQGLLTAVVSVGQVPHAWFWHFYLLSVACSAFWAWQFLGKGAVMGWLAERQRAGSSAVEARKAAAAMMREGGEADAIKAELGRVFAAWIMMALQGSRRLYETLFVMRTGASRMWFVHWALGLAFYAVMSLSIWIEGSGTFASIFLF